MSSRLDNFIREHRDDFEDATPSPKAWQNIEAAIADKKKKQFILTPIIKWSMAAAAVLLISITVYFAVGTKKPETTYAGDVKTVDTMAVADAPEVNQFAQMIALKQQELRSLAKEQPELYEKFSKDINQLDSSYNILKKQLKATPNREILIEAMIQNLQLQLNVLNQQLNIINQIKQKNYSYEKVDPAT